MRSQVSWVPGWTLFRCLFFPGMRYATTVPASGLPLRSMGVQECNIVPVVASITKYAHMVIHPEDIRYHLEKALYMAATGRPGPVWLDLPLDVQGAIIETESLRAYDPCRKSGTETTGDPAGNNREDP